MFIVQIYFGVIKSWLDVSKFETLNEAKEFYKKLRTDRQYRIIKMIVVLEN